MRLRDIMSEAVESIPPDAPVDQAREQMRRQDVRHLAVAARSSVSSQHDLRRAQGMAAVRSVMSASAVTATPQTSLREAANLLRGDHVSCLPVLDGRGSLIGMVTVSDPARPDRKGRHARTGERQATAKVLGAREVERCDST